MTEGSPLAAPFALPAQLDTALARVRDYWLGLRRGQADIPFTDDVKLSAVSAVGVDPFLIDVLERPLRFRVAVSGPAIAERYGQVVDGLFADEIAPGAPLQYLLSQCSACLESRAPSYYRNPVPPYSRLVLPLWGDGHINGLLGAISQR